MLENATTTRYNPYSWNEYANVFFVEQPVGVGFSYADHGESVVSSSLFLPSASLTSHIQGTTEEAAKDIAAFVAIFFNHFTEYKGRPFHLAGESYGVRFTNVRLFFALADAWRTPGPIPSRLRHRDLRPERQDRSLGNEPD